MRVQLRIPSETIELVRTRLDIVELVGEHVQLSRAGRNMKGRCPFHNEKTPSFIVSPERQTFHCFGCGEGGDGFSFVMKTDGLSFMEAIEKLAARVGVKIEADRELSPDDKDRVRAREALEFAAHYYHDILKKDPAAEAARAYVAKRRLSKESVDGFLIGYAPRSGSLVAAAAKKGFPAELLLKCGLAAKRADGTLRDYFFDRLLFPIRDVKGSFVGFGGRIMGEGEPKYLNSPESIVFAKSRVLYGLYEGIAETRKARRSHLMEGYMDVISAHQHGLKNACAPLGTALTPEHAALIKRYVDSVFIVFDADTAGQNAAVRGGESAVAAGIKVLVATVPEGKDPDELLQNKGLAELEEALGSGLDVSPADFDPSWRFERIKGGKETTKDLVEFKTDLLIKRAGELTAESKSAVAQDVLATIMRNPDPIVRDEWMRRLAKRLDVSESALKRLSMQPAGGRVPVRPDAPAHALTATAVKTPRRIVKLSPNDLQMLELLVKAPTCSSDVVESDFESRESMTLAVAIAAAAPFTGAWAPRFLDALEDEALKAVASRLLSDENLNADPESHFRMVLDRRRKERRALDYKARFESLSPDEKQDYMKLMTQLRGSKTAGRA